MNCPHCGNEVPDVADAFCPHCHGELEHVQAVATDKQPSVSNGRGRWIAIGVGAVLALTLLPLLVFPLAGLVFLGVTCCRAAITKRPEGWVIGLLFGAVFTAAGLAGIFAVFALRLGWFR